MHARIVTFVALAACAPATRTEPSAPAPAVEPAPSTKAVAEPYTPPPAPPEPALPLRQAGMRAPTVILDEESRVRPYNTEPLTQKRSDLWDPCVRDFVQTRAAEIRDELGDALTQAMTTCIRETRTVTFEPPRSGRAYATGSHVGIAGVLTPTTTEIILRVVMRGQSPERLTILAGNTRWTSPPLEVTHDAIWGRELAAIPYTKTVARVVRRMLDTDGAMLRFESATGIEDIAITEELAVDLRTMMDVVEEL
ncbi:MAG: hypothetical protein AB7T06_14415 [Kofleriaceae bacterium]